jgi:phosphate transport system substrate-binding protein
MASSGYCSNYTVCATAASKRVVDLALNRDHCPDCGMMLHVIADLESLRSEAAAPRRASALNGSASATATAVAPPAAAEPPPPVVAAEPAPAPARTARTKRFSQAPPPPPAAPSEARPAAPAAPSRAMLLGGAAVAALIVAAGATWAVAGHAGASPVAFAICGSDVLGGNLGTGLAQSFLEGAGGSKIVARPLDASGEGEVGAEIAGGSQRIAVRADGAGRAYAQMAAGSCQAGIVDRPPTSTELAALRARDAAAPAALSRPLALDAVAVVVNPSNPVSHLTLAQVSGIFSGAVTSWSQVGGPARPIVALAPPDDFDVASIAGTSVLENGRFGGSVRRLPSERALSSTVAHDRDAIGLVPFSDSSPAKVLALGRGDAFVAPSALSIGKTYPLTLRLGLYVPSGSAGPLANRFVAYLGTADASNVIGNAGLVPAGP